MNEIFNMTQITELGQQEALKQAHSATAVPSIWILFGIFVVALFLSGVTMAKSSRKFWMIFYITVFIGAIAAVFFTVSPNVIQTIWGFFAR